MQCILLMILLLLLLIHKIHSIDSGCILYFICGKQKSELTANQHSSASEVQSNVHITQYALVSIYGASIAAGVRLT